MDKKWEDIKSIFSELENNKIEYVLLRSYDNLLYDPNYLEEGHDIDILCRSTTYADCLQVLGVSDAMGNDFCINIGGRAASIDIVTEEDDEYPQGFLTQILNNRIKYDGICHIPSDEDAFYSLAWHCVSKGYVPERYLDRLRSLSKKVEIDIEECDVDRLKKVTEAYFKAHNMKMKHWLPRDAVRRTYNIIKQILKKKTKGNLHK